MNKLFKKTKGFTLIELLVVIAILGIVILLGMPRFAGYVQKAELTRIQHDIKVMENHVDETLSKTNDYKSWSNNEKDLGSLILRKQLFEKEGIAKNVSRNNAQTKNDGKSNNYLAHEYYLISELSLFNSDDELFDLDTGYKVIPEDYKKQIKTRLKGTFYTNDLGKVYYEHGKSLNSIKEEKGKSNCAVDKNSDIIFDKETGTIVSGGCISDGIAVIPPTMIVDNKEYKVNNVGQGAYQGMGLTQAIFPEDLIKIEDYAFAGNQLIEVNVPNNVEHIGNYAFAYNELNGKPTIDSINIQDEEQVDKVGDIGDIEENGSKIDTKGLTKLLDQIFVTGVMKFEIPEDYNPIIEAPLKIKVNPEGSINDKMDVTANYEYEGKATKAEWKLNGDPVNNIINRKFTEGTHTVRVRVLDESGEWTKWAEKKINVEKYVSHIMNKPGSPIVDDIVYGAGNDLIFEYVNNCTQYFDWNVPITGTYKVDMLGAGADGKGSRVQGELKLAKDDIVSLKIHSRSSCGGTGGIGGVANGQIYAGYNGKSGSGGSVLKLNNKIILAAGGAGGNGANGRTGQGAHGDIYYPGKGGAGGAGGLENSGHNGARGTNSRGNSSYTGGSGGGSAGGGSPGPGTPSGRPGSRGGNGPTAYDGGGGGGSNGGSHYYSSAGAGGGGGGRSFVDNSVNNKVVTAGYNTGNGRIIITLIK